MGTSYRIGAGKDSKLLLESSFIIEAESFSLFELGLKRRPLIACLAFLAFDLQLNRSSIGTVLT